jgi:hypothetical protein
MQHKYTKREKKQFVKLLEAAKIRLWSGHSYYSVDKERFICHAIRPSRYNALTSYQYQLLKYIKHKLDGSPTIEEWLFKQGIRFTSNVGEIHSIKIQKYRLDWINHMIQEFSK